MNRDLSFYLFARLVSLTGDSLGNVALLWWLITSTGSAFVASMVMAAYSLCFAFSLPFLGVLSDRMPKRDVMLLSELVNLVVTIILAILSISSTTNSYLFVGLVAIKAVAAAALSSASTGFIGEICTGNSITHAFKYVSYTVGTAGLLGGASGGALVAAWGVSVAIAVDAISCLVGAGLLSLIVVPPCSSVQNNNSTVNLSWYAQLKEGAVFFREASHRTYMGWLAIFSFVYGPLFVIFAILVKDIYHLGAFWLGCIEFALAIGLLVGGLASNRVHNKFCSRNITLVSVLGVSCGYFLIGFSNGPYVTAVGALVLGTSFTFLNINITSRLWALVPDGMGSRITSIFTLIGRASTAISLILLAYLVEIIGIKSIIISLGSLWCAACVAFFTQKGFLLFISSEIEFIRK